MGLQSRSQWSFQKEHSLYHFLFPLNFDRSFYVFLQRNHMFPAFSEKKLMTVFYPVSLNYQNRFFLLKCFHNCQIISYCLLNFRNLTSVQFFESFKPFQSVMRFDDCWGKLNLVGLLLQNNVKKIFSWDFHKHSFFSKQVLQLVIGKDIAGH